MAEEKKNPGDAEKITRAYLDSLLVEMRHIDSVDPSAKLELYEHSFDTPVMLAALSHLNKTHPEGLVEAARGIKAVNAVMWCGMGSEEELEAICNTGAGTIKIIKPYKDNRDIFKKIEHAEKTGCIAMGMDVDHQFGGMGSWYRCAGFDMAPKTLEEIRSFVKATKLPFIIKGVTSEVDARKCLDAGIQGIVVSHHHGMVPYPVPPLQALPRIVRVINGKMPIFVDCSIDTGMDAFKAIALGAAAVSVGRAIMPSLKEEGAAGVTKYINQMTDTLRWAMAVTCSKDLKSIDPSVIWHAQDTKGGLQ
ncbi:MAG: alpha-hydroxy-acid oxidizing protein [Treponema sp.]|jgi:isopentenyl diphosphate isomerase/L-lactate dehydrogenase-like FMN-dependent dehydrogenase|nr:alpha-hydroxy-acid oxidizing protein [Treponema sp.]